MAKSIKIWEKIGDILNDEVIPTIEEKLPIGYKLKYGSSTLAHNDEGELILTNEDGSCTPIYELDLYELMEILEILEREEDNN